VGRAIRRHSCALTLCASIAAGDNRSFSHSVCRGQVLMALSEYVRSPPPNTRSGVRYWPTGLVCRTKSFRMWK
jgi:hypothetical protein